MKIESGTSIEVYNASMETGNRRYVNEDIPYSDGAAYQVMETSKEGWEYLNDVESPMPDGWYYIRKTGSDTDFEWVNQTYHKDKVTSSGVRSIKVRNNNINCTGGISTDKISIKPGQTYVLSTGFGANDKLIGEKGRLSEYAALDKTAGLSMQVVYYDADGEEISTKNWESTAVSGKPMNINWQVKPLRRSFDNFFDACCTIYAVTKNLNYAIRAREILKYQLEDMKWGMRYRTTSGYNTKMNDAYEAVHTGRTLQRDALGYDMIYDSGVIDEGEDTYIRRLFNWVAYELTSTSYYNYAAANGQIHNYNADRISALTLYMLCFPDNKGTEENKYKDTFEFFYNHVLNEKNVWSLPTMFKNGVYDAGDEYGGMWCENMRYHRSVLAGWLLAAKALDRYDPSMKWLEREELKKMARMWCTAQGPKLVVSTSAKNMAGYPTVGDQSWRESVDMAAWCASIYQKSDPKLSKELMYTWDRLGSMLGGSYPINTLMDNDPTLPRKNPKLTSMSLKNVGYTYFWQNFDVLGKENFVLIPNSPGYGNKNQVIHDHHDRGSFAYFANGTPMSLDTGMGAYFGSDSAFWRSSKSHNEILFWSEPQGEWLSNAGGDGNSYTSDSGKKRYYDSETKNFVTTDEIDRVTINVNPEKRDGKETDMAWNRHFAYIKDGINALIFWDEVNNMRKSQYNLYMASTDFKQDGDIITANMQNNMQMEVHLLGSGNPRINATWVPSNGGYSIPTIKGEEQQQLIQYEQENGEDYLTVLFAKNSGSKGLSSERLETENSNIIAYRMTKTDSGKSFYIVCNAAKSDLKCSIGNDKTIREPESGEIINSGESFTIEKGSMRIFIDDSVEAPVPVKIELTGETSVGVPSVGDELSYNYEYRIYDQYGCTIDSAKANFEVESSSEYVVISQDGKLTMLPGFESGSSIKLKAKYQNVSAELNITADDSDTVVTSAEIIGSNVLVIPENGSSSYTYHAVFKNISGTVVSGIKPLWTLADTKDGIQINSYTGTVNISSDVSEGTVIHINVSHMNDPSVNKTFEVLFVKAAETGIYVNAPEEFGITEGKETFFNLAGYRTNQQGDMYAEGGIIYSLKVAADGVSIDENGKLTIGKNTKPRQTITITAQSISDSNNKKDYRIKLIKNTAESVKISGVSVINAGKSDIFEQYTASVIDKNGAEMTDMVTWSVLGHSGVSVDNGIVKVSAGAGSGTAVLRAALDSDNSLYDVFKIKINGYSEGGSSSSGGNGGKASFGSFGMTVPNGITDNIFKGKVFIDVPMTHWAAEYIYDLVKAGAVNGRTETLFEPEEDITRAEFVKILVKALNLKTEHTDSYFEDVRGGDWYYESVVTAYALGIINGYSSTYFGADEHITREQMAAMVYRALSYLGIKTEKDKTVFEDDNDISEYAKESVLSLKNAGVLNGKADNRFMPKEYAKRAEISKVISVIRNMI